MCVIWAMKITTQAIKITVILKNRLSICIKKCLILQIQMLTVMKLSMIFNKSWKNILLQHDKNIILLVYDRIHYFWIRPNPNPKIHRILTESESWLSNDSLLFRIFLKIVSLDKESDSTETVKDSAESWIKDKIESFSVKFGVGFGEF